jgi:endonuclease G
LLQIYHFPRSGPVYGDTMLTTLSNRPNNLATMQNGRGGVSRTREGYDENFLGIPLPLPEIADSHKDQVAPLLSNSSKSELEYTHFSVVQNKLRRTPFFTAANVDGAQYNEVPRDGKWGYEPRIAEKYQIGSDAYGGNDIDRGHMVRRRDPMWGSDAHAASKDTFVYTNAALQHAALNQHEWLDLENHILNLARTYERKVSVFTGPVLKDSDPDFDNKGKMAVPTKMPMAFWKVMVWNEPGEGLKSESFVMSQEKFINGEAKPPSSEQHLSDFSPFRIPLDELEELTHLDFGNIIDSPTTQAPVPPPPGGGD